MVRKNALWFVFGAVASWAAMHAVSAWQHLDAMPAPSAGGQPLVLVPMEGATATVHAGTPNFRAASYSASGDGRVQSGIFSAEGPSTFDWHYGVDETVYIQEGEVHLDYMGRRFVAKPGETVHFQAGTRAHWHVPRYVQKSWTVHEPSRLVRWWRKLTGDGPEAARPAG